MASNSGVCYHVALSCTRSRVEDLGSKCSCQILSVTILTQNLLGIPRTSDDVLETEDARTEYSWPKIWVKLAHAYTADTRLSCSSTPRMLLESRGMRLMAEQQCTDG